MKRLIHFMLGRIGLRILRIQDGPRPSEGLDPFFSLLQKLGFKPHHILDVGANRGDWTRTALKHFPAARYTLVEPQDHLRTYIQDLLDQGHQLQWINAGAGDHSGSQPMSISSHDYSSTFVLTDRHNQSTGSQQLTVPVRTLNEIVATTGAGLPEMVKIDAEGFDLHVLRGASDLLGKTEIFLVEAVVCGNYENSVAQVVNFMAAAGYSLMDITDLNRSTRHGVLWLTELAFLHNSSHLLDGVTCYE